MLSQGELRKTRRIGACWCSQKMRVVFAWFTMGDGVNLANALANAMLNDRSLYSLYATAMLIYKENAKDNDKE